MNPGHMPGKSLAVATQLLPAATATPQYISGDSHGVAEDCYISHFTRDMLLQ